jgi:hypothetical protein
MRRYLRAPVRNSSARRNAINLVRSPRPTHRTHMPGHARTGAGYIKPAKTSAGTTALAFWAIQSSVDQINGQIASAVTISMSCALDSKPF